MAEYARIYDADPKASIDSIREQDRIEVGLRTFLDERGYTAFKNELKFASIA